MRVFWVLKPERVNESESRDLCRGRAPTRRTGAFAMDLRIEHVCWDPKDGELCLNRVEAKETLVEARSDSDVANRSFELGI